MYLCRCQIKRMEQKPKFKVAYLPDAIAFLQSLNEKVRDKIAYNIGKSMLVLDKDLCKKLGDTEIWEFRTLYNGLAYRLLAFWDTESDTLVLYSDRRSEPILKYIAQDSIFWENYGATAEMAKASLISQKNMIEEGSTFAGALPVSYLIPHWKTVNRTLFNSGSVHMRDAAHLARSNEWEDAYTLWVKEYESTKSKKRKMWCANNIAVYYEMKDEITKSLEWARIAEYLSIDLFDKDGQVERFGSFIDIPYIHFFKLYTAELEKREANLPALSIQMQRHNDDF